MANNEDRMALQRSVNSLSAQPCGCDPGCQPKPWVCEECQKKATLREIIDRGVDKFHRLAIDSALETEGP